MKKNNILLDMDGVLTDFTSSALQLFNRELDKSYTIRDYVTKFSQFEMYKSYGISVEEFWKIIESEHQFWINLQPFSWAKELYEWLKTLGDVTIVTTPSEDPECVYQKMRWLKIHLDISSKDVMFCGKKHLLAGNGILIDDWDRNVNNFISNGGEAILVPSNWNTLDLTYKEVQNAILGRI